MKLSRIIASIVSLITFYNLLLGAMPTVEVSQVSTEVSMPVAPVMPAEATPMLQVGMPTITPEGKVIQPAEDKKKDVKKKELLGLSGEKPSVLEMDEVQFVMKGIKSIDNVIDLFVGPLADFSDAIPPSITSLFGPFAHVHWSLIIRSLQKRVEKARQEYARLTGKIAPVPKKDPAKQIDYMAAMQQEIKKKEPKQKAKINILKFLPTSILKAVYDGALQYLKIITKPVEKKSLAVTELFEPLPPIPFLVTISDIQFSLHILSLQQRMRLIEESLKNNLEPLDKIKAREKKNAVKIADLDPMVAMVAKDEEKKAKEAEKKIGIKGKAFGEIKKLTTKFQGFMAQREMKPEKSGVKLKTTKEVQKIYSEFQDLNEQATSITKPIEILAKDLPVMPVPLISFLGVLIAASGAGVGTVGAILIPSFSMTVYGAIILGIGAAIIALGGAVYGVSQAQFAIYIRNLQELLKKLEEEIRLYQESKKEEPQKAFDPTKVLEQAQERIGQQSTTEKSLGTTTVDQGSMPAVSVIDAQVPATDVPAE